MYLPWKTYFLKRVNIESPQKPAIPLLSIYQRRKNIHTHTHNVHKMLQAALFRKSKSGKNTTVHLRLSGWIKCHIDALEYYSALKKMEY